MSRIVPSGPRGSRGAFLRAGAVALLILAHGSCYDSGPDEYCYADVMICGVRVEGLYARYVEGEGSGCYGGSDYYWAYGAASPRMTCDGSSDDTGWGGEGSCTASVGEYDLRAAGWDARGSIVIDAQLGGSSAVVTGRRECIGEDCDVVFAAFGVDPSCGERTAPSSCAGDTAGPLDSTWDSGEYISDGPRPDQSIDYRWDDRGLTVELGGFDTSGFDFGMAETIDMWNGWFGEDCMNGSSGYQECHVFTGPSGTLTSIYDDVVAGSKTLADVQSGSTTLFEKSHDDGGRITYVVTIDGGDCFAWGQDPRYYDAWGCSNLN